MTPEDRDYLWDHFKFNAEQRLKAFNFFVVLSVFANGGVFAAVEKKLPALVLLLVGGFIVLLAVVFWLIDARSKWLVDLAVPGLRLHEENLDASCRLFEKDAKDGPKVARFTVAFRILFLAQVMFGASTIFYALL
jgi:heme A synthase